MTKKELLKLANRIPNNKNDKSLGFIFYARTYKGMHFYEAKKDGVPCMRFIRKGNKYIQFVSMHHKLFGRGDPANEEGKFATGAKSIPTFKYGYGAFGENDKEPLTYHKHDLRKYVNYPIADIVSQENLLMGETAIKEGGLDIYNSYAFNREGKTLQEMFKLDMSNSDLHKLKTFISANDLREYQDYHATAIKARGKRLKPSQYFIKTGKQAHKRDNDKLNKIREEERKRAHERKENIKKGFRKEKEVKYLLHCSTKEDVVLLGKELHNCVGGYTPDKIGVYELPICGEKIAVEYDGKIRQARGIENIDVPKRIKEMISIDIERKLNESRKIKTNKSK